VGTLREGGGEGAPRAEEPGSQEGGTPVGEGVQDAPVVVVVEKGAGNGEVAVVVEQAEIGAEEVGAEAGTEETRAEVGAEEAGTEVGLEEHAPEADGAEAGAGAKGVPEGPAGGGAEEAVVDEEKGGGDKKGGGDEKVEGGDEGKVPEDEGEGGLDGQCVKYVGDAPMFEKGFVSNVLTFAVMVLGVILRFALFPGGFPGDDAGAGREPVRVSGVAILVKYVLAFGLFGFAGGITNWLAVKMLFDKIPGVYGSGIIPNQFMAIRRTIKEMIMDTFFDVSFLKAYIKDKGPALLEQADFGKNISDMLSSKETEELIGRKLYELGTKPEGMLLVMMNLRPEMLQPLVVTFVKSMADDIGPMLSSAFSANADSLPIQALRDQVDEMMEQRLLELSPERVKRLVEAVMRTHLGWLVVWGNIFGGLIGIIAEAAGY